MNVQEMIAALKGADPARPAAEVLKEIREKIAEDALRALATPAGIKAAYPALLAKIEVATDRNGNRNANLALETYNALRSEVQAALQFLDPVPSAQPEDEGDPELVHARQKAHGKKLWKKADALVAAAGVTEKGVS